MKTTTNFYTALILIVKLLPIILILAAASCSNAQELKLSTYIEKTKMSPKLGHSLGLVFPGYLGDMEVGGFYQRNMLSHNAETTSKKQIIEEQFYGFYMGISFIQRQKVNVNFNVRTGLVNGSLLAITPSVFSDFMLSDALGFGLGLG
ncbi:hypothetical protein, partial [Reichenbachiella sp. MALMAid0571]|uniref:hypothetical protein n=1 Tax=Reichenbachiella sp. MALMAid0571 TaxID=3143939 RepID=UPI0032DF1CEC